LAAGKTHEQALAELNVLQAEISQRFEGADRAMTLVARLTPLREQVVDRGRAGLWLLLGAIGAVLLVACLNLGNLLLVRAVAGERETAIRAALGAARARIWRAAMIENLVLASLGGVLGAALAFELVEMFAVVAPANLPRADEVGMDATALGFALLLSVCAALVFGSMPALRSMRANPQDSLRGAGRSLTDRGGGKRAREWLVVGEVGLSATLLIVAGLLASSFVRLGAVERGYETQNLLTAELNLPAGRYPDVEARRRFYDELIERLDAQPNVAAVGVASVLPLRGEFVWVNVVTVEGDARPIDERPVMSYRAVSPDFFRAMGITLQAGRPMQAADYPRQVAIVSRAAAERLWPGESPIGKTFRRSVPTEPAFEVVGVANDVRSSGLDREPPPLVYVPLWVSSPETGAVAIRTVSDPVLVAAQLRESVMSIDPGIPVSQIETMAQIERESTAQRRFQTLLVSVFATCALLLAAIGIYGVVAYSAARRTSEIGLRIALGAGPRDILTMVLRQGLWPIVLGVGAGVVGALALGRFLSALLFGVEAHDPATFAIVAAIVLGVAAVACWIPARRAMRTAPLAALRSD
jgi:predicted permease